MHANSELREIKKHGNTIWTKGQDKTPETNPNEMKICELPDRKLETMIINVRIMLRRVMHEQR